MAKSLVIVESPAKAKTISRILGPSYAVEASYGHIRDLPESADDIPAAQKKEPWARLGVNVEDDFTPLYVVSRDKKKYIANLKKAMQGAEALLLATDEDREGESISWHVVEVLKPKVPVQRIAFHEITPEAVRAALEHPRDIDQNLVKAQESRRILDRLFGYELSPVLWKKVKTGLSAGRVQSVAVRLTVERERERRRFRAATYWDAEASFEKDGQAFTAKLVRLDESSVATGQDFEADTGELKSGSKARWLRAGSEVEDLLAAWGTDWAVASVEEKPLKRRPAPPFTTSSLQQEANRKLRFTAKHTMSVAQRLYEGIEAGGDRVGLITYMRTDSFSLAERALAEAQRVIKERYGDAYTEGPRRYKTKSRGAQEAHEAIRPTELARTPEQVKRFLSDDEYRLYDLIWKRTVASQMSEARLRRTSVEIVTPRAGEDGPAGVFAASGTRIEFPGFLRVYVEGSDDPAADLGDRETLLPELAESETLAPTAVTAQSHETQPPARYTEASLIQRLEKEGIGRPSTYASILDTIQRRGYVVKQGNALVPTFTAWAVTQLLEQHFGEYVDLAFTARMEEQLDDIAEGDLDWLEHLRGFYYGEGGDGPGLEQRIAAEEPRIDYPRLEMGEHPESGQAIRVRVGRYGPYLQMGEGDDKVSASIPEDVPPADLTLAKAVELLAGAQEGDRAIGNHPDSGEPIYLKTGRYGPYVQLGEPEGKEKPRRASLPRGFSAEDVTLEGAVRWLSMPRTLGEDPESGEEVVAAVGRFGPFVKRGGDTRSVPAEDDVYTLSLERALELLAQPKTRGKRRGRTVLKELGTDSSGAKIELLDGRYGPYLTNGELNASLPKGESPDGLTAERAAAILSERGKPPKRGRGRKKSG
ncbi:MAG: type I DNA topoisomerase [Thermoanaerobaculia bacterium]